MRRPSFARISRIEEYTRWADLAVERLGGDTPTLLRHASLACRRSMHALAFRGSALDLVDGIPAVWRTDDVTALFLALWAKAFCLLEMGRFGDSKIRSRRCRVVVGEFAHQDEGLDRLYGVPGIMGPLRASRSTAALRCGFREDARHGARILSRIVVIEGSSSIAPQDDAETAIAGLRTLLGDIIAF